MHVNAINWRIELSASVYSSSLRSTADASTRSWAARTAQAHLYIRSRMDG